MSERAESHVRKRRWGVAWVALASLGGALSFSARPTPVAPAAIDTRVRIPERAAYLLVGGGADPDSTQVSMDQDLGLLQSALHGSGVTLFAAGPDVASVQRLRETRDGALRMRLAGLFDPRDLRHADLARPSLHVNGPAFAEVVVDALDVMLPRPGPLLMWFATHGSGGEHPAMSTLPLWGGFGLSVSGLAEQLDGSRRDVRVVVTACHGGGFAEMIYRGADPEQGYASARCGFFAAPYNDEAAGCDSNPDRGAQESYAKHFTTTLATNEGEHGRDLNGDGRVTLREAHTVARAQARSIDRPFATSDYLLAQLDLVPRDNDEPDPPAREEDLAFEERWLINALGHALSLPAQADAETRFNALEAELDALDLRARELERDIDDTYALLRIALLERFPFVDDPWREDFDRLLHENAPAIEATLASPTAERYRRSVEVLDTLMTDAEERQAEWAQVDRLLSAYATVERVALLRARGGEDLHAFRRFLACERATLDEASMISATP